MLPYFLSNVNIIVAPVPIEITEISARGVLWQAAPECFLLDVPNVARYMVTSGHTITIDPAPNAKKHAVNSFLKMAPMAAILYQRGFYVFHSAAVANEHGAVLLAGESGVGKSTLMTTLLKRGWRMLADDLAIVGMNTEGQALVYPNNSGISLWPDSIEQLGIDSNLLQHTDANRYEYSPSMQTVDDPQPLPLRGIYRMNIHSKYDEELEFVAVTSRFRILGTLLYNSHVADALCNRVDYLRCMASIANSVPISDLRRPRGKWSVNKLANIIEEGHVTLM